MEISDIKQRLSILTVMQNYNLELDRNNQIKCPFHEDNKPSCRIYINTNTFHCFGCNATDDQIEFIGKYENCSKHEAILKAKQLCGNPEPIIPPCRKFVTCGFSD